MVFNSGDEGRLAGVGPAIHPTSYLNGYTPLHDAVSGNHVETAKVLVEAGAKLNIRGHDDLTPLDIAKANGNEILVKLLSPKRI